MTARVLFLGSDGDLSRIVYNRLAQRFPGMPAVIEEPPSRWTILRYRMRKLGILPVVSQIAFLTLLRPILRVTAKRRIAQICDELNLNRTAIPQESISRVASVNAAETIDIINRLDPKVIVVKGTRIISRKVLAAGERVFINTHTGITPAYRGSHGGYWALHSNDPGRCGVTIHVIDAGIDTGEVIAQRRIEPSGDDDFVTYPYLQTGAALLALADAVEQGLDGRLQARPATGDSAVWYHPGFFQYLAGWMRGIK